MDAYIKEWIKMAGKISRYLLYPNKKSGSEDLQEWLNAHPKRKTLLEELGQPEFYSLQAKRRQELNEKYSWENFIASRARKQRHRRLVIFRYAASVVILLAAGSAFWLYNRQPENNVSVATIPSILPGNTRASLTLANGREIVLDNRLTLTEKDGTVINNNESGEISYKNEHLSDTVMQYNILRVPRGGEYRLTLADGTKVWVNSESEIKYPTHFAADKREVFLKGEAYFEIAHDPQHPFFVNSNYLQVHATGTAFNVMAYSEEPEIKVILVEGGVNIEESQNVISKLTPNHQFAFNKTDKQFRVTSVDPRVATSWKNGTFFFSDEPLASIIRKLIRWYNVDIECDKPELYEYKFSGEIRKYEDAAEVLNMLKLTNEINYTIQTDKKIVIYAVE